MRGNGISVKNAAPLRERRENADKPCFDVGLRPTSRQGLAVPGPGIS